MNFGIPIGNSLSKLIIYAKEALDIKKTGIVIKEEIIAERDRFISYPVASFKLDTHHYSEIMYHTSSRSP
jgi:hypothetical protein